MTKKHVLLAAAVLVANTPLAAGAQVLQQQVRATQPFSDPAYDSLCHLYIKRRVALFFTPKYTGSAVLYRGRYLLTAGHNVYQDNSSIRSVEVRCGVGDASTASLTETIEPWQALDASDYTGKSFVRDFGVIRLNHPVTVSQPFMLADSAVRPGAAVRFAGYPGGPHDGWKLFAASGMVTAVADSVATYDIETFKSNSGGPVWQDAGGVPQLLAIHVTGSGGRIVDVAYVQEVDRLIAELDRRAAERGR